MLNNSRQLFSNQTDWMNGCRVPHDYWFVIETLLENLTKVAKFGSNLFDVISLNLPASLQIFIRFFLPKRPKLYAL